MRPRLAGTVSQYIMQIVGAFHQLVIFFTNGSDEVVNAVKHAAFTLYAADLGGLTALVGPFLRFNVGKHLVHTKDVAHIGIARVGPFDTCGVGGGEAQFLFEVGFRLGQRDVVIIGFAHLALPIKANNFWCWGVQRAWLYK